MLSREELVHQLSQAWPIDQWKFHRTIVAVSGGSDSVALACALAELARRSGRAPRQSLTVAHFNHRLRGSESDLDEQFVRELAAQLELDLEVGHRIPTKIPADSSEETLRMERYAFLQQTARQYEARYVATAHTCNDQCETLLFRMLRGTSVAGLRGMQATRPMSDDLTLVRPLLWACREELERFLQSVGQRWRVDSSNSQLQYTRNRIRHELVPVLLKFNPNALENIAAVADSAAEYHHVIESLASQLLERVMQSGTLSRIRFDIRPFLEEHVLIIRHAFVLLWQQRAWPLGDMTRSHWRRLESMVLSSWTTLQELNQVVHVFPGNIRVERVDEHELNIVDMKSRGAAPLL
ncbi:MAG TPA: tRNA lysidine(34) synthetase TilS [Pirellulaceae bacterium]|nr:tRNA lysidine(34) synthetase TilS [Pirellulaceae bacterium]